MNYQNLFFFLQQSLSGMRYMHYAPKHVLYNHHKIDPASSIAVAVILFALLSSFTCQSIYCNGARAEDKVVCLHKQ